MNNAKPFTPGAPSEESKNTKFNVSAAHFVPTTSHAKIVDPIRDKLDKLGFPDEKHVKDFKEMLKHMKDNTTPKLPDDEEHPDLKLPLDHIEGAINLQVFMCVSVLPMCKTDKKDSDELSHCVNANMLKREVVDTVEAKKYQYSPKKQQRYGNRDDFNKGQRQNYNH